MMIKILLGGSPCTFWSIAKNRQEREVKAEGLGWELFKNYVIAKEKFKPDFFLYENNVSAALEIKEQVENELGVKRMEIDSALVSAQSRKRFYCFNWVVEQPTDRCILFEDIEYKTNHKKYDFTKYAHTVRINESENAIKWDPSGRGYYSQQNRARKTNCKMNTLPSAGTDKNNIWLGGYEYRKIHPVEAERLQTMPDNYTEGLSTGQRIKALGNGWTAEVIIHILQGALKDVPKDEEIVVLSMYDGIGTGRYCLDKMGFTNVKYFAYEIDKYAKEIALKNYPDIIQMGDAFQLRHPDWTIGY